MYTTYHFNSPAEITPEIVESIKTAFKGKSVVITVEEDATDEIPEWHKELAKTRIEEMKQNPETMLSQEAFESKLRQLKK